MEENTSNESNSKDANENNTNESESKKASAKDGAASKDNKKKDKTEKKGPNFFERHKAEFKKIKWPSRQELFKETVIVIIISLGVGAVTYAVDTVLQYGFGAVL